MYYINTIKMVELLLCMREVLGSLPSISKEKLSIIKIYYYFSIFSYYDIMIKGSFSFSLLLMTGHLGFCDVRIVGMQIRWLSALLTCERYEDFGFCFVRIVRMQQRWQSASREETHYYCISIQFFLIFAIMSINIFSISLLLMTCSIGFCYVRIVGMQLRWQSASPKKLFVINILFLFNFSLFLT